MNNNELIDRLCNITSAQAEIIKRQQSVINQNGISIEDKYMEELLSRAEEEFDLVEYALRRI